MTDQPNTLAITKLLAVCAVVGVVIALLFTGFEELLHEGQHFLWVTVLGDQPSNLEVIALATLGGVVLGLALRYLPGHGGHHPADAHDLLGAGESVRPGWLAGTFIVGLTGLSFGASLGPEGAILPVTAGIAVLMSRWLRVPGPMGQLVKAAAIGALLAAMLGSPLAGLVPLMEVIPAAALSSMAMLVLPSLTAGATAVLTLQVLDRQPSGLLPLDYTAFRGIHLLWAVLIGIVAGAVGLAVHRGTQILRKITLRLDARK